MRTPLNKSFMPSTKGEENAAVVANTEKGEKTMNKELEKIKAQSAVIMGDYPQKHEELVKQLAAARAELKQAQAVLEGVEDLESYDSATEAVKRAELRVKFAAQALDKLESAPRMSEEEYSKAVQICQQLMDNAIANYREKAPAIIDQLKALQDNYLQAAADITGTLKALDNAANILQVKYPYAVQQYWQDGNIVSVPTGKSPTEWEKHAVRFYPSDAFRMATSCEKDPKEPHKQWDSVLAAAWNAVEKAYPRTTY